MATDPTHTNKLPLLDQGKSTKIDKNQIIQQVEQKSTFFNQVTDVVQNRLFTEIQININRQKLSTNT